GHVVGLNIARAGRIDSLAVPASVVRVLLKDVTTGKFHRPELEDIRRELKNAETMLERIRRDRERLRKQLTEAEGTEPPDSSADTTANDEAAGDDGDVDGEESDDG